MTKQPDWRTADPENVKLELTEQEISAVERYFSGRIKLHEGGMKHPNLGMVEFWRSILKVCAAAREGVARRVKLRRIIEHYDMKTELYTSDADLMA